MRHEAEKYLLDMADSCGAIKDFAKNRTIADLEQDRMFRRAMEREFEITGEALRNLAKHHPKIAQQIPEWRIIIGFRNVLAHGYDKIDIAAVWGIVEGKLEELDSAVHALLKAEQVQPPAE